jgi:hypothetical protein
MPREGFSVEGRPLHPPHTSPNPNGMMHPNQQQGYIQVDTGLGMAEDVMMSDPYVGVYQQPPPMMKFEEGMY